MLVLFQNAAGVQQYRKMKKSNFQYNYQYYNHLSRSRYSSRNSRRLKSQNGDTITNRSNTRFYHRLEKACTTFSSNDMNKQINLCRREIQRLQKQVLKKDKIIFQVKEINMHNKEIQAQLIEVYRVLYLYQGKIQQYQRQLKKLEVTIASKTNEDITAKVEELLESYRFENSELSAQLQQKNRIIMQLEGRMRRTENKYFNTAWKLSSTQRQISNPLKKRFPNLRNTITLNQTPLLQKQKAYNMRNKSKNSTAFPQNQYQIQTDPNTRQRESIQFKKTEASPIQQQYRLTPVSGTGGINNIRSNMTSAHEPVSFINPTSNFKNNLNISQEKNYQNQVNLQNNPTSMSFNRLQGNQRVQPQSNANISSQVTVNSGGTVRRVDSTRIYRHESPKGDKIELVNSPMNNRYAIAKSSNEAQGMSKSGYMNKYATTPIKSVGNGQSIYLS